MLLSSPFAEDAPDHEYNTDNGIVSTFSKLNAWYITTMCFNVSRWQPAIMTSSKRGRTATAGVRTTRQARPMLEDTGPAGQ